MTGSATFVGIDVRKHARDVAIGPDTTPFRVANDPGGGTTLIARLDPPAAPPTIVLEATGPDHVGGTLALAAGMPPAVLHPAQTHAGIRSEGRPTTTDRTAAQLLARFGQQTQPTPSPVLPQTAWELQEVVACRDDFTHLLTLETNRLHGATDRTRAHHQAMITHLTAGRSRPSSQP